MKPRHALLLNHKSWIAAGLLIVWGLAFLGCASSNAPLSQRVPAPQTAEQLLSAAGFKQIFPTTPTQQARLKNMPQKQIFLISKGPKVYYVYADASGSGCLYAGSQQNYQNFQTLLTQSQLVAEQYQAAQMNAWDWNTWGPGWGVGETGTPE
jgi:hypothetical protein